MRANEYQTRAMSTRLPSCENATYMLFGLMAEIGEIADKIAKWRRKGVCRLDMDHLVFNTGDLQEVEGYKSELMKEVGDCAWFIAGRGHAAEPRQTRQPPRARRDRLKRG